MGTNTDQLDDDWFDAPVEEDAGDVRARLSNMVRERNRLAATIGQLESELSELRAKRDEYDLRKIPDALLEAGLTEITTVDGLKVKTKLYVGAIPADRKGEAFEWMDKHGFGSIIKREVSVSFDKNSTEAALMAEERIKELGLTPRTKLDVHYQTFQSFAKEQMNKGTQLPLEQWGVYYGQKAVISEK